VYAEPLTRLPGARSVYSDLNAILLGLLVEAVAGAPLSNAAMELVFDPLGMGFTTYGPLLPEQAVVAPSRQVGGRPVPGEVDDANARRLGSVAGHAGLFSTGLDLAKYAQAWLRRGARPDRVWVSERTISDFLSRSPSSGTRALGWDTPDRDSGTVSAFGSLTSDSSFGHTGWTGTLMWIDPERDLFLVFLSNRSLAPRHRNSLSAMRTVRAQVSDVAARAALAECSEVRPVVC
jgi:CubicO group peptidase (beta-lactamase class C family)